MACGRVAGEVGRQKVAGGGKQHATVRLTTVDTARGNNHMVVITVCVSPRRYDRRAGETAGTAFNAQNARKRTNYVI